MPRVAPHARQPDRDWLLDLGNMLQTTLEVGKLVELFADHSQSVVQHDSVSSDFEEQKLQTSVGTSSRFTCTYDVILLEDYLGTITFTRSTQFTEDEMGLIEYMLVALVHPLRNACLYREALQRASHDPLTGLNNRTNLRTNCST